MDRRLALEALGALCNGRVTSQATTSDLTGGLQSGRAQQQLSIQNLIYTTWEADVSRSNPACLQSTWQVRDLEGGSATARASTRAYIINEDQFFDAKFDHYFTKPTSLQSYSRGGETYERPYGWHRFGLKVLDKYEDNKWLGTEKCRMGSVPGEWPVSYHGTSKQGAEGIIRGAYEPGSRKKYGRGVYSTPALSVANSFSTVFTFDGKKYKAILQNRINPQKRRKCECDGYWLVPIPEGTSKEKEQEIVRSAIRPYGLLVKEV